MIYNLKIELKTKKKKKMEILYACTFTKSTSADNHQHASMEQHFVWRQNSHNQDACSEAYL